MKKITFIILLLAIGLAAAAQHMRLNEGVPGLNKNTTQRFGFEPAAARSATPVKPLPAGLKNGHNAKNVSIITIGSDVNAWNCGYNSFDHKTMLWADDTLKAITYIHGMGPLTPEGFLTAHLGIDLGINMGLINADWTKNQEVYTATMDLGGGSYADEVLMPQAAIYSPPGNTSLENAYVAYFAMNFTNNPSEGGYSHGASNLLIPADSSNTLYWYDPPPYSWIPQGFTITNKGIALMVDVSIDHPVYNYMGDVILGYGIWNPDLKGFEYTISTLPMPVTGDTEWPYSARVAASPDGNTVWIINLANNGDADQIGPFKNYYPVLFKSTDGGLSWSDPITVQLDGPDGIDGVKNYMSDHLISTLYSPPVPSRDEIAYTTAFDCDLSVDLWGNPHIGVVVGLPPADYHISFADSTLCVFDIYSTDGGLSWEGAAMGHLATMRGTYGSIIEDNRVHIASTEAGDKMFVTWNDTKLTGASTNDYPDVFARGFDLVTNMITADASGEDQPDNVTEGTELNFQAYFESTSHYVFTGDNKFTIPIVTELMSDRNNMDAPVTFKYIPNFSYEDADFSIPINNPGVGIDNPGVASRQSSVSIYPNPVKLVATFEYEIAEPGPVTLKIFNNMSQEMTTLVNEQQSAGKHTIRWNAQEWPAGVYYYRIQTGVQSNSGKLVLAK
jgi:hypothetical protein